MRVPKESVIYNVFGKEPIDLEFQTKAASEDLSMWSSSKGGHLDPMPIYVEAGWCGGVVFALITLEDEA